MAGITLMGAGTFGSPAGVFAADRNAPATGGAAACDSTQECVQPAAVPSTGNQDGCTAIAGLLKVDSLDASDSYWHFVVPASEGFELSGTGFNASFDGSTTESVTYVQQQKDGGYKGVVVEADGGATLTWAFVPESAIMDETSEAEGTAAEDTNGNGDFVLSSTCAGTAVSTTSTSSSSSTTSSTQSTTSSTSSSTSSSTESTTSSSTESTTSSTQSTTSTSSTTSSTPTTSSSSTTTSSTVSTPTTTSSDTTSSQTTSSQSSTALTTTVTDPSSSTSTSTSISPVSSSSSSAANPSTGVLGASTTTPSTGADVEFGFGIALLLGGASVMIGATRINRNKRQ